MQIKNPEGKKEMQCSKTNWRGEGDEEEIIKGKVGENTTLSTNPRLETKHRENGRGRKERGKGGDGSWRQRSRRKI